MLWSYLLLRYVTFCTPWVYLAIVLINAMQLFAIVL